MKNIKFIYKNITRVSMILGFSILLFSCEVQERDLAESILSDTCWIHSFEEDGDSNAKTFRPCESDYPAAWFRQIYYFHENGACDYLVLAPNDGHYTENGNWEYFNETNILQILDSNNDIIVKYEVVSVEEGWLVLKE